MTTKRLNLIAAVCENYGIGVNGDLPWKLKSEMAYFNRITSSVTNQSKYNVVIMGRKTWETLPERFRPLKGRINIVLSSTMAPDSLNSPLTYVTNHLEAALSLIRKDLSDITEEVFIIGGSNVYDEALNSLHPLRLYYTRIFKTYQCDTFFPKVDWEQFTSIKLDHVPSEVQVENEVEFQYEVYDRE